MSRRQAREVALQALFQLDMNPLDEGMDVAQARQNAIDAAVFAKDEDVKLEVGQERSIANISDDVRTQSSKYLTDIACISNFNVVVSVQSISSGVVVKKRRLK